MIKKVPALCLATALIASSSLWAADPTSTTSTASNAVPEKAMPYGDNPSLGRVLLYKTGKGMQNLGDSIQGASDNTSQKISEKWQDTKKYTEEQSEVVQAQTEKAKQYTAKKWQDTKDAVVGTNEGNVPIERAELSQPSSN
ncbi:hypothetical protein GCM10025882_05630 [Acinetobacter gyllenbergii]|uniref:Uncharacterized protein n=1 Tax=Acinetobacter gyllenbergii CIP 110306 = MTCC 11365 TaxID=1217657 RepID=A0A829HLG3_9GAMM|nr:hypothetical protein [Acinetobacter gyllenbergii]EPF93119.1 hypothetical protein F957_00465 [Acinetobacter gyllenbergii CIP 110306 = MTCC 11365]EPH31429.1 hypothetical protein L293_2244 [Acinetobacter gyllenbergii CIP 110306 = MTCC 11365]GMA10139.1 hypothetical protein GCM10025882_05630 [Acinetobacter gyllenbergii]